MMKIDDRLAIVTGGAGGIGHVISRRLAQKGFYVLIIDCLKNELDICVHEIESSGYKVRGIYADISSVISVNNILNQIIGDFTSVDVLVNSAGIQGELGPFFKSDINEWEKVIRINLLGTVNISRAIIPQMIKQKKGKIINFSGGGATGLRPNFSAYAVSKTAVVRFTEILAKELFSYNIQVNAVAPGAVNTHMLDEVLQAGEGVIGMEYKDAVRRKKEGGTSPDLVADLVCYLASDQSDWLTGKLISAVWDPWKEWMNGNTPELSQNMYTLRRVDGRNIVEK